MRIKQLVSRQQIVHQLKFKILTFSQLSKLLLFMADKKFKFLVRPTLKCQLYVKPLIHLNSYLLSTRPTIYPLLTAATTRSHELFPAKYLWGKGSRILNSQ